MALTLSLFACQSDSIDDQKPIIDPDFSGAFPSQCTTLYIGEPFDFKARFTDNAELGSFSINIHHNFDQHSHSTEVTHCETDPPKEPVNPFVLVREYEIPRGKTEYIANQTLIIPDNDYDEGDYHFFISLTDKEGWRIEKGISIKIRKR